MQIYDKWIGAGITVLKATIRDQKPTVPPMKWTNGWSQENFVDESSFTKSGYVRGRKDGYFTFKIVVLKLLVDGNGLSVPCFVPVTPFHQKLSLG